MQNEAEGLYFANQKFFAPLTSFLPLFFHLKDQQKTRKVQISKTYETLRLKKGGKKLVM